MFDTVLDYLSVLIAGDTFAGFGVMLDTIVAASGDVYPMMYMIFLFICFSFIIVCLTLSFVFKFLLKLVD